MNPGAKVIGVLLLGSVGAVAHVVSAPERSPLRRPADPEAGSGWPGLKVEAQRLQDSPDAGDRMPRRLANRPAAGSLTIFEQENLRAKKLLRRQSGRRNVDDPRVDRFGWRDSPSELSAEELKTAYPAARERRRSSPPAARKPLIARPSRALRPPALKKNGSGIPKARRRGERPPRRMSSN